MTRGRPLRGHAHVPVLATSRARRALEQAVGGPPTASCASGTGRSCAPRSPPTAAARRARRAIPSSSCSTSARTAVAAAVAAQRALAAEAWPDGGAQVRVRMGLHTGEANRSAARSSGSTSTGRRGSRRPAHGGQILVSDATRALVVGTCRPTSRCAASGAPAQGPRASRAAGPGRRRRPADRRSRRSARSTSRPNNLPTQLTTFVGREAELAEAEAAAPRRRGCSR